MAHEHDIYMLLVEAALQTGNTPALENHLPQLEKLARRDNHGLYLATALRARGALHRIKGEFQEAEQDLQEALSIFQKMDTRWQCGRTCVEMGKLSQSQGDSASASQQFMQAQRYFEEVGALPDLSRVIQEIQLIH